MKYRDISVKILSHDGIFLAFLSILWAYAPDTMYIAWPCTVSAPVAALIPNAERLSELDGGRLVLRYWEAPRAWLSAEDTAIVAVFPVLPDAGYPKPDFTVPDVALSGAPESSPVTFFWPLFLALFLGLVLFHRRLGLWVRQILSRLYWRIRWEAFLLRYALYRQLPLVAYAQALFRLLMPYCDFHPGSLLPSEATSLLGPPPLRLLFQKLLPPLYQERFLKEPLSAAALQNLRRELHTLLMQARPYISMPHRHRLCLCP